MRRLARAARDRRPRADVPVHRRPRAPGALVRQRARRGHAGRARDLRPRRLRGGGHAARRVVACSTAPSAAFMRRARAHVRARRHRRAARRDRGGARGPARPRRPATRSAGAARGARRSPPRRAPFERLARPRRAPLGGRRPDRRSRRRGAAPRRRGGPARATGARARAPTAAPTRTRARRRRATATCGTGTRAFTRSPGAASTRRARGPSCAPCCARGGRTASCRTRSSGTRRRGWRRAPLYATRGLLGDRRTESVGPPLLAFAWEIVADGIGARTIPGFAREALDALAPHLRLARAPPRPRRRRPAVDHPARRVRPRRLAEVRRRCSAAARTTGPATACSSSARGARAGTRARIIAALRPPRRGRLVQRRLRAVAARDGAPERRRGVDRAGARASRRRCSSAAGTSAAACSSTSPAAPSGRVPSRPGRRSPRSCSRRCPSDVRRRLVEEHLLDPRRYARAVRDPLGEHGGARVQPALGSLPLLARAVVDEHRVAARPGAARARLRASAPTAIVASLRQAAARDGLREYYDPLTGARPRRARLRLVDAAHRPLKRRATATRGTPAARAARARGSVRNARAPRAPRRRARGSPRRGCARGRRAGSACGG